MDSDPWNSKYPVERKTICNEKRTDKDQVLGDLKDVQRD